MKTFLFALDLVALAAVPAAAASCRDANGKFIKCALELAPKNAPCKDAKGKLINFPA